MKIFITFVFPVLTFLAGYFAEKGLDRILKTANERKKKKAVIKFRPFSDDIAIIAKGCPYIQLQNLRFVLTNMENFLLPEDDNLTSLLPLKVEGIDDETFRKIMQAVYAKVSREFAEEKSGNFFNGKLYGIISASGFERTVDSAEQPILTYKLFETDYFTHKVIENTLYKLPLKKDLLNVDFLNEHFSSFRTSLGVSVIVVLPESNQIIITKRTKHASYSKGQSWYYISVTETFSQTDYDEYKQSPNIVTCIKRGMLEELGIDSNMYDENTIRIYDAFFEKNFLQDNIVASIELNKEITIGSIDFDSAKDSLLEIEDITAIDNTKHAIDVFIKNNHSQMRAQTVFSLESYAARL